MQRPEKELQNLRPNIPTETEKAGELESFQNNVLRPILKFQHDLFVADAKANPLMKRCFQKDTIDEQRVELKNFFAKNAVSKYAFIGMISGLMTSEEFSYYLSEKATFDKRLSSMLIERLIDGMQ